MKKVLVLLAVFAAVAAGAHAASFTQGDLAILREGDGATALSAGAAPIFIDEYTTAGAFVQTIVVSTNIGTRATASGTSTSEGQLTLSGNGQSLTFGARDLAVGANDANGVARVIGVAGVNGTVNTTTRLTVSGANRPPYQNNNIRMVYSPDGNQFYLSGNGSGNDQGIQYVSSLGATSSTNLSTTVNNTRGVQAFNGRLYLATASSPGAGIYTVGTGIPTTTPQTATILSGNPFAASASYTDFYLSTNGNTLITLNGAATFGLEVFALSAGNWSRVASNTVLGTSLNLTAAENGSNINIFYTSGNGIANTLTQTNSTLRMITWDGSAFVNDTQLAVAGVNQTFKGIDFVPVPEPSTVIFVIAGVAGLLAICRRKP